MPIQCEELLSTLESGETERVNTTLDALESGDFEDRIRQFDACFDELTQLYSENGDGYVRQSCLRAIEKVLPGMAMAVATEGEQRSADIDRQTVQKRTDTACEFLLEAITDPDGRVRKATKRDLKKVARTYDALGDVDAVVTLTQELDAMANEYADDRRKHLLEAKEAVEFFNRSHVGRIVEGLREKQ